MSDEAQNPEAAATNTAEVSPSTEAPGSTGERAAPADDATAPTDEATAGRPKKKRKKRRGDPARRGELDAAGMQRPAFVLDFPEDPELDVLVRAFEAGNFAFVREHAPRLAESSSSADVKAAARELSRRIEPDPLVKFLLGVAGALFLVVVSYVYHSHGR